MRLYTYDTSVIIARNIQTFPRSFRLSQVVVTELIASANDESRRQRLEAIARTFFQDGELLLPSFEDWIMASKVLYWLHQQRKKKAGGRAPKLPPGASQRMAFDALIAVTAKRADVIVVTENWDDFKAIQYYCPVKLIKASDFFQ